MSAAREMVEIRFEGACGHKASFPLSAGIVRWWHPVCARERRASYRKRYIKRPRIVLAAGSVRRATPRIPGTKGAWL